MKRLCSAFLAIVLGSSALTFAQPNSAVPATGAQSAPAISHRIDLDVVVTDKSGKPVTGLTQQDFTLLDDKQPGPILAFHEVDRSVQKTDPPLQVIVLIDTVNLPMPRIAFIRQEFQKFLRQNAGHLAQPVTVFWFTGQGVKMSRKLYTDGNALAAELDSPESQTLAIRRMGREYNDVEHLALSIAALTAIAQSEAKVPGKKLLIWPGHGWPMLDNRRVQLPTAVQRQDFQKIVELSTRLREARISLYSASFDELSPNVQLYREFLSGVKSPDKMALPNLNLRVLAVQSGGRVVGPDNHLADQIADCVRDADAFYSLSFDPPRAANPDEYHDLKIEVDKPGLQARTNTGYYNQP